MGAYTSRDTFTNVTPGRIGRLCLLMGLLLAAASFASLFAGTAEISVTAVVHRYFPALPFLTGDLTEAEAAIITTVRLPRVVLAAVVGASLSVAGVVFQALLRNPLADPYILGISSGSAVGAVLGIITGAGAWSVGIPGLAFLGALAAVLVVFGIAGRDRRLEVNTLLLTGVMVNAFFSAVILFIFSISDHLHLQRALHWIMGDLSLADQGGLSYTSLILVLGTVFLYLFSRPLNLLVMGEETARQLGLAVERTKLALLAAAALITAAAVSASGTIGFVGLIIPHILRLALGPDHRLLLPAAFFLGAAFLVTADTLARCLAAPTELPVGVITALCGAPYFLFLLRRRLRSSP
ncbi:MAG TPA: iron ABC transporter permease [Syntrophales bacterium]|nr:iron ABC transporter permease [Syntrophales bacterium]HOM06961.1 iron ABC transporter permease [Syntrophales bacterium]HON98822.1 iron ABC transporter permease [Syntrophales bacterium]HPQ06502.1 iron ABC transporter permease [Syntrophales bacterium]HRS86811.1 iron ABC transporter permease [Syntrophales bacterium]